MERYSFEEKTLEQAIKKAEIALEETRNNLLIKEIKEDNTSAKIEVIEIRDINNSIKEELQRLLRNIGYISEINIIKTNENIPKFIINSNNDSLLIGKNGKNLLALKIIIQEILKKNLHQQYKFIIDVADYNENRERSIIKLAENIAKEVQKSKIPAQLDSMNSYERMIVHNALKENKEVYTESAGEEPNRYVIIKPIED